MRVLVLGPTGVVGDAIVRTALRDSRIQAVGAVSRRPLTHSHPKLRTILHANFGDFEPLESVLADVDVVLCALGLSWYQAASEAQYRQITHDYVLACARTASVANAAVRFCFVSGHGASPTSSQAWARIKADTEQDLAATFGSRLTVFRPGYVHPVHGRETPYWGDTVMRPFMPLRAFMTGSPVRSPADNREIIAAAAAYLAARRADS
jgi:uncharacterized protein YbjT (DUF2867 family)